jgi:hypothetical protein
MKKPRPSPAGPKKSLYAAVSRTRKLFGSPAQGEPNKFGAPHTGRLIETEHDNHPKELRTVRNSRALNAMPGGVLPSIQSSSARGDGCHPPDISRPNGS